MFKNKLLAISMALLVSLSAFSSNANSGRVCSGARPDNTKQEIQTLLSCYNNRIKACKNLKRYIKGGKSNDNLLQSTSACPKKASDSMTAIGSYIRRDYKRIRGAKRKLKGLK